MNKKQTLLKKLQAADFVAYECVLYLDGHPNNKKALEKFKTATAEAKKLRAEYESLFGALTADASGENGWCWVNTPWPWQRGTD